MTPEDQIELERAGRRCEVCQTGRRPRQFEVVRPEGRQPIVMCPACKARYGVEPPLRAGEKPAPVPAKAEVPAGAAETAQPDAASSASPQAKAQGAAQPNGSGAAQPNGSGAAPQNGSGASGSRAAKRNQSRSAKAGQSASKERSEPREDRLRKALRELPHGEHSVARIAKAAGLNHEKTVRRLHTLHEAGEVQQVGKRWSNEPPSTDIEAAMDRLQARTTNLRIVRDR
ncbi:MAG TPA: hypothetical protein VMF14_07235 [Solirubrobacteraceae bacterium]|nr:hypothetical protein [Solirubrobacteraceae bacterium]